MNHYSVIRQLALCCALLVGALPRPAAADLCTAAGLPATAGATFLGFGASTKGGNAMHSAPFASRAWRRQGPTPWQTRSRRATGTSCLT
jgi:hypothetical protein